MYEVKIVFLRKAVNLACNSVTQELFLETVFVLQSASHLVTQSIKKIRTHSMKLLR